MLLKKHSKKQLIFSSIIFLIAVTGGYLYINRFFINKKIISPVSLTVTPIASLIISPVRIQKENTFLKDTIQKELIGKEDNFGIFVKNLKTSEQYAMNEHKVFKSASLYKLWVMATVYEQIKKGKLDEENVLSDDVNALNDMFLISSESAELSEGVVTASVKDALYQMITRSDNYSALLLSEKIGLSSVASFLKNHGFIESKVGIDGSDPTTTAHDTALFFEKLYNYDFAEPYYSDKMLNLLKAQALDNKIPKYLPADTVVAHKTGELYQFTHDAGIVYAPNGDYIIVVLSESDDPVQTEETIASLSKQVYDYFAKKFQ